MEFTSIHMCRICNHKGYYATGVCSNCRKIKCSVCAAMFVPSRFKASTRCKNCKSRSHTELQKFCDYIQWGNK